MDDRDRGRVRERSALVDQRLRPPELSRDTLTPTPLSASGSVGQCARVCGQLGSGAQSGVPALVVPDEPAERPASQSQRTPSSVGDLRPHERHSAPASVPALRPMARL